MKQKSSEIIARRQAKLDARLDRGWQPETTESVLCGGPICYEISDRVTGIEAAVQAQSIDAALATAQGQGRED